MYNSIMTTHRIYVLGTTAQTMITPVGTQSGMDVTIQNVNEYGYIYIGSHDVTSSNYGYRLLPSHAISFELNGKDDLYLVAEYADMKAAVLKVKLEQGS
jgi:hypothetical protein